MSLLLKHLHFQLKNKNLLTDVPFVRHISKLFGFQALIVAPKIEWPQQLKIQHISLTMPVITS